MSDKTATSILNRNFDLTNLRRYRADSFAAALMMELDDVLPHDVDRGRIMDRLVFILNKNGAYWTTDEERSKLGFEPRDDLGWTPSEHIAQQKKLAEAMQIATAISVDPNIQRYFTGSLCPSHTGDYDLPPALQKEDRS
jgi:hypothetical protein